MKTQCLAVVTAGLVAAASPACVRQWPCVAGTRPAMTVVADQSRAALVAAASC